jgi:hypothetical protein
MAADIGVEHAVEVLGGELGQAAEVLDPGVAHENVEPAESPGGRLDDPWISSATATSPCTVMAWPPAVLISAASRSPRSTVAVLFWPT